MSDLPSRANAALRAVANRLLPGGGRLRGFLSDRWDGLLGRVTRHVTVPVAGRAIRLGVRHRRLDPAIEADTLGLWLRLVRPGDVVWDVGANVGLYTLLSAGAVGPAGRVVAFEPAPGTFAVLADHVRANGHEGVCELVNAAVSDRDGGSVPFRVLPGTTVPMNRIAAGGGEGAVVAVPAGTLDGFAARLGPPPRLVKLDIEGAEVLALRGAAGLLGPGGPRPVVLLAVHPMFLPEFGCAPAEVAGLFDRYGYRTFDVHGRPAAPTGFAEYLCCPAERAADLGPPFAPAG